MKKYIGWLFVVLAIAPVAAFLGIHEVQFFSNTFKQEDNQAMAYLGYMLTGGGLFLWLGILSLHAKSGLQKATSFVMIVVCTGGALAVALFNIYMTTMSENGFEMTKNDIKNMTIIVGVLAIFHMVALIVEVAGEAIIQAWQDDDGDGIPNIFDKKDNRKPNSQPQNHQPQNSQPKKVYQNREPFYKKWFRHSGGSNKVNVLELQVEQLKAELRKRDETTRQPAQDGQGKAQTLEQGKDTTHPTNGQ